MSPLQSEPPYSRYALAPPEELRVLGAQLVFHPVPTAIPSIHLSLTRRSSDSAHTHVYHIVFDRSRRELCCTILTLPPDPTGRTRGACEDWHAVLGVLVVKPGGL